MSSQEHIPVLLKEAVNALVTQASGVYIDGTFGRGGHSREILSRLDASGVLRAVDQDMAAIRVADDLFAHDKRFDIAHANFAQLESLCEQWGISGQVDGVLLDIGVSSPQLDDAMRGFSFMHDGPLDMRMNQSGGITAKDWLADVEEEELANVIYQYGEERNSRRIARYIVRAREEQAIETTSQLANIVAKASKQRDKNKHPATRTFQAIRIFINQELTVLARVLSVAVNVLKPGGRLVVISFHSLEDRIVKVFMREQSQGKPVPRGVPVLPEQAKLTLKLVGKAIKPSEAELVLNPRARSSVLRVAEKLHG